MISAIRSFFSSRIGIAITLGFLGLIAILFALSDVTGSGVFGGVSGDSEVAQVGGESIGSGELIQAANALYEQERAQNPSLDRAGFVDAGGVGRALDQLIEANAIAEWARDLGFATSKRLVDSEIANLPAFKGADGKFNETIFRQAISSRGFTERAVREDLSRALLARQSLAVAGYGARLPLELAKPYASLLLETRDGAIAFLPSAAFAPKGPVSEQAVADYYQRNRGRYTRPERRAIRYALFTETAVGQLPEPTEEELRSAYDARRQEFAARELRGITQVILPTEPAAKALADQVRGGRSLESAASAIGLSPSRLEPQTRDALATATSAAVAQAAFAAERGTVAPPARGPLGWHVARVDSAETIPARTFETVRTNLRDAMMTDRRQKAFADLAERIEGEVDEGVSLAEIARSLGVQATTTPLLLANGTAPGQFGYTLPAALQRLLPVAFAMEEENAPQLGDIGDGKTYALVEASRIVPAAPAPLADIRSRVAVDAALASGAAKARAAADRVMAAVAKGTRIEQAVSAVGVPLPQVDRVRMTREQALAVREGGRVPPPLALMFSMAERSAKRLEAPGNAGWFVVRLDDIAPGSLEGQTALVSTLRAQFAPVIAGEFQQQLVRAAKSAVTVRRNESAIRAAADRFAGRS